MPSTDDHVSEHAELVLVRHGESLANVAFCAAEAHGTSVELGCRDADVALSPTGWKQATALGHWLRDQQPPELVWCSPYLRARQTWQIAARELPETQHALPVIVDERLRDREMGQLELHTPAMVRSRYPDKPSSVPTWASSPTARRAANRCPMSPSDCAVSSGTWSAPDEHW